LKKNNDANQVRIQQAARLAARGKHGALFNLLFPICLVLGFSMLYIVPLVVAEWLEPSQLSSMIKVYLRWGLPVPAILTLVVYFWARKRLLAPFLDDDLGK